MWSWYQTKKNNKKKPTIITVDTQLVIVKTILQTAMNNEKKNATNITVDNKLWKVKALYKYLSCYPAMKKEKRYAINNMVDYQLWKQKINS